MSLKRIKRKIVAIGRAGTRVDSNRRFASFSRIGFLWVSDYPTTGW